MKLDVLLSAMNLKDFTYIDTLNITGDCVVINQCDRNKQDVIHDSNRNICYIETTERGLSKSRNMAIANAKDEICILCDNDVEYVDGYEELILEAFRNYPDYDIIVFHVASDINPHPCYPQPKKMGYISCCKAISYEIAFRRERVLNIHFDENIGAGTKYKMGEENAFLYECLRRGLHIHYIPLQIAKLRYEPTTWNTGFDANYMVSRGASFTAMTNRFSLLLILQFAVRKYKLYRDTLTFWQALGYMRQGKRQYRKEVLGK